MESGFRNTAAAGLVFMAMVLCPPAAIHAATGAEVESFTGAHTRVVWKHDLSGKIGGDNAADSRDSIWEILGFDSRDNQVRTIVRGRISAVWPKLNHDGTKVLYCGDYQLNGNKNKIVMVNWDGTGRTDLGEGGSITLWYDRTTATEWVYVGNNYGAYCGGSCRSGNRLERFPIDKPGNRSVVWQGSGTNNQFSFWFSVSGDGKYVGGGFANGSETTPSILDPATGKIYVTKQGCFGSISPDTMYRFFRYDTPHMSVKLWDFDPVRYSNGFFNERDIMVAPLSAGTWGMSWTNNGNFSTHHTNPYGACDVYLLKWNSGFTAIQSYLKVSTYTSGINCMPSAWISPGQLTISTPVMRLSSTLIDLSPGANATTSPVQTVTVSNAGVGTLQNVSTSVSYSQGTNWVTVSGSGSGNSQSLANTISASGLPFGVSVATVTVTCPNAVPATVTYQIRITKAAPLRSSDMPNRSIEAGLSYSYYRGTFTRVADLDGKIPVRSGTVATFSLAPKDTTARYGFIFSGFIDIPQSGEWTFRLGSDDGAILRIGDSAIVDNDGIHTLVARSGMIGLEEGLHRISVSYFQGTGPDSLRLDFSGPSVSSLVPVSSSVLFHEISSQPLILLEPLGDRMYRVGDTITVRWTSDTVLTRSVYLEISVDGGLEFIPLIDGAIRLQDASWGVYRFVIPATFMGSEGPVPAISPQCMIKVQDYNNSSTFDTSPSFFTITSGAPVRTSPTGRAGPRRVVPGRGGVTVHATLAHRVMVLNAGGKKVWESRIVNGSAYWDLRAHHAPAGTYYLILAGAAGQVTAGRFNVIR